MRSDAEVWNTQMWVKWCGSVARYKKLQYLCISITNKAINTAMKINRLFFLFAMLLVLSLACKAEEPETAGKPKRLELGLKYIGELQTDFKGGYNFLNYLRLSGTLNITPEWRVHLTTLSTAKTNDCILGDMLVFSNIEVLEDIPLTLAVAGVEWERTTSSGTHSVFAGIRNVNEDYFSSELTAFYINSSCGIFPTIAANYPIANYPFASVGLHYAYDSKHWGAKASVYNGVGYYRFTGRENLFRVCPGSDGLFFLAQGEYKGSTGNYFLGGSMHKASPVLWTYAEQTVYESEKCDVGLIGAYSHCFDRDAFCRNFVGLGAKVGVKNIEMGLFTQYADFFDMHEFQTELNCSIPVSKNVYVMPALHYVNGSTEKSLIGMMRLGVEL